MFHCFGFVSWISFRSTGLKFPIRTENKIRPGNQASIKRSGVYLYGLCVFWLRNLTKMQLPVTRLFIIMTASRWLLCVVWGHFLRWWFRSTSQCATALCRGLQRNKEKITPTTPPEGHSRRCVCLYFTIGRFLDLSFSLDPGLNRFNPG